MHCISSVNGLSFAHDYTASSWSTVWLHTCKTTLFVIYVHREAVRWFDEWVVCCLLSIHHSPFAVMLWSCTSFNNSRFFPALCRWRETLRAYGHEWSPFYWAPCRLIDIVYAFHSHVSPHPGWYPVENNMLRSVAGFPLLKTRPALPSQDVELRSNARRLLSQLELVHVEAHSLREAPAPRRRRLALLWDVWSPDRSSSWGEARIGRVLLSVLFGQWAGPTEEQGEESVGIKDCTHFSNDVQYPDIVQLLVFDTDIYWYLPISTDIGGGGF